MSKFKAQMDTPQLNYKVILSVTLLLTTIGLIMVLSASMVDSYATANSVWMEFIKQLAVVCLGFLGMWAAMRMSIVHIKQASPWLMLVALALLIAVPFIGVGGDEVGNHSWIRLGPIGIQPSEAAKLALAVWGSAVVSDNMRKTPTVRGALGPLFIGAALVLALVLLQKDLGMVFAVGIVVFALMFVSGISVRALAVLIGVAGVVGVIATVTQSFRSARMTTWIDTLTLNFSEHTTKGAAYQSYQGILSLSDGGILGAGLGQSRAKWFYLPEAKNDFIFAVVGEELGLLGAFIVVLLFAMLGWFGIRTARNQKDPFLRLMAVTLTIGVVVQAFYNMGYVVGFFPMTGIQLPLISAGGSSAIITLITMGLLANCARHEPATISSMQHEGRPLIDRILMLPEPTPYQTGGQRREARRTTSKSYGEPVERRAYGQPVTQRRAGRPASQDVQRERERQLRARRRAGVEEAPKRYDRMRRHDLPRPNKNSRRP